MLQRFPDGAAGKSFYQKRIPNGAPDWLQSTTVVDAQRHHVQRARRGRHRARRVGRQHRLPRAAPVAVSRRRPRRTPTSCASTSTRRRASASTRCAPPRCAAATCSTSSACAGYPKTTGSNGLHVYLRLEPRWDSVEVRAAAVALARELERRHPERDHGQLVEGGARQPRLRRLQPERAAQDGVRRVVRPAPHGRPGVDAAHLGRRSRRWSPDELTIRTVPDLVRRRGDPWADIARAAPVARAAARAGRAGQGGRAARRPVAAAVPEDARRAAPGGAEPGQEGLSASRGPARGAATGSRSSSSAAAPTPTRCGPSATRPGRSTACRPTSWRRWPRRGACRASTGVGKSTAQVIDRGARGRRPRLPGQAGGRGRARRPAARRRRPRDAAGVAARRLPLALGLVRRRQPHPRDGRGGPRPRPRVPRPDRPQRAPHRGPRAERRAPPPAARRARRAQRGSWRRSGS